ncbi:MAG: DUF2953 domain-containing protein [Rhodobacteraceae bacterium]|nr:DUF2953 domain-containing protein [Paracoccaceae bacterium]
MILSVILWLLLALGLAVVAVLVLPVRLRLRAHARQDRRLRLELGLLGGLVPWIMVLDTDRPKKPEPVARKTAGKSKAGRKRRRGFGRARGMRAVRAVPKLLGGLLRCVRVQRALVDCVFGLDDPAETGQVFGQIAPVIYAMPGREHVALRPDFTAARLEGEAELALAVVPVTLLGPVVRFAWAVFGPRR